MAPTLGFGPERRWRSEAAAPTSPESRDEFWKNLVSLTLAAHWESGNPRSGRNTGIKLLAFITRMKRQLTAAFVCLHCRKVFKRPSHRRVGDRYQALDYTASCPKCQTALLRVGDVFRAPPQDDSAAWERVERDISRGRAFIRDEGFGRPPARPKRQRAPKGVHSLFQLPARKRRRKG